MNLISHHPAEACMEAWLNCENLLINLGQQPNRLARKTAQVIDECAQICMGTYQALSRKMLHISELALLCVGICEECAEICEQYEDAVFQNCASACRRCSASITGLAAPAA